MRQLNAPLGALPAGSRKAIAFSILLAALLTADCRAFAQQAKLPVADRVPDCDELLESVRKLRTSSLAMLAAVRSQRNKLEEMRTAVGPDVVAESAAVLLDQEMKLLKTLRSAEDVVCSPVPVPPQDDTPAKPAARP